MPTLYFKMGIYQEHRHSMSKPQHRMGITLIFSHLMTKQVPLHYTNTLNTLLSLHKVSIISMQFHLSYLISKEETITFYNLLLAERLQLEKRIQKLQKQINNYPKEQFICTTNGKYHKWYQSDGKTATYIPKNNRHLAEQLCTKKYLTLLIQDLSDEIQAIDSYLAKNKRKKHRAQQLLLNNSECQKLLSAYFRPLSDELTQWMLSDYDKNTSYPKQLIHPTSSGGLVRSKSEAMIHMLLTSHQIPFRYECALELNDAITYPDFTIRHPKTGATFYWEHFGLMEKTSYRQNMLSKLQHYTSSGIIPSIQLITTYETSQNPLTSKTVENLITQYFL